jgi:hypothetical protein
VVAQPGVVGCHDAAVILTVRVPEWELHEDARVLAVGDEVSFWLTFDEAERGALSADLVQVIRGVARPVPRWPGAEFQRHPTRVDLDGAALYWNAPQSVAGAVEIVGTVSSNNVDAPQGFPETRGVVRRVRMEWQELVLVDQVGTWSNETGEARYEEVPVSYLPATEVAPTDPVDQAAAIRRVLEYRSPVSRLLRRRSFAVAVPAPRLPVGTTQTRWTGVLIDMEVTGSPGK